MTSFLMVSSATYVLFCCLVLLIAFSGAVCAMIGAVEEETAPAAVGIALILVALLLLAFPASVREYQVKPENVSGAVRTLKPYAQPAHRHCDED